MSPSSDSGQTLTEYAFVLTLIAVVAALAFTAFGSTVLNLFGPVVGAF